MLLYSWRQEEVAITRRDNRAESKSLRVTEGLGVP